MKIAKNFLFLCVISLSFFYMAVSCKKDDAGVVLVGNWLEDSDYDGDARADAVAFSIGNIGYVGTGYNGDDLLKDFYAYDADRDNVERDSPFSRCSPELVPWLLPLQVKVMLVQDMMA